MIKIIITLALAHYFGDFILQPQEWALTKWNNQVSLLKHIIVYSLGFFAVTWLFLIPNNLYVWCMFLMAAIFNGVFHYFIDYTTAKLTHQLAVKKNMNIFWKVIGFDQFLHYVTIAITYGYLYRIII